MGSTPRSARTSPPRLSHVVPRARLFRTLDRLRASPIVWIQAPAGLAQYSSETVNGVDRTINTGIHEWL